MKNYPATENFANTLRSSLTGVTADILKTLLIHYEIKIKILYEMIFIDSFVANIQPATENGKYKHLEKLGSSLKRNLVFALSFDFLRLVPLGNERRYHTQAFPQLENKRRNHILAWKWDPFNSEPEITLEQIILLD